MYSIGPPTFLKFLIRRQGTARMRCIIVQAIIYVLMPVAGNMAYTTCLGVLEYLAKTFDFYCCQNKQNVYIHNYLLK